MEFRFFADFWEKPRWAGIYAQFSSIREMDLCPQRHFPLFLLSSFIAVHVCHDGTERRPERPTGSSLAARVMRVGPSGTGCRTSPQTARRCGGLRTTVVNGPGKGGRTRQV